MTKLYYALFYFSIVKDFSFLSDFEDGESIELEKQELSTYLEERLQARDII